MQVGFGRSSKPDIADIIEREYLSGALALWMREKFPDVVIGAVGSSGPVLAQLDFYGNSNSPR